MSKQKSIEEIKMEAHMKGLSLPKSGKECGALTVLPLGYLSTIVGEFVQAERDRAKEEIKQALRNVPVGFVRQWINEDLLKDGHRLVTNEDIQGFINIALTNPQDHTPDRPLNYERD